MASAQLQDGEWHGVSRDGKGQDLHVALTIQTGKVVAHSFGRESAPFDPALTVDRERDVLAFFPAQGAHITIRQVNAACVLYERAGRGGPGIGILVRKPEFRGDVSRAASLLYGRGSV